MPHKQKGVISIGLIIAIVVATILAALLYERYELKKKVTAVSKKLSEAEKDRDLAVDANRELKADLKTQEDLLNLSRVQALKYQKDLKEQEKQFSKIEKKVPKPIQKAAEPVETPEVTQINTERIEALWEAFCIDNTSELCVNDKEPKQ